MTEPIGDPVAGLIRATVLDARTIVKMIDKDLAEEVESDTEDYIKVSRSMVHRARFSLLAMSQLLEQFHGLSRLEVPPPE